MLSCDPKDVYHLELKTRSLPPPPPTGGGGSHSHSHSQDFMEPLLRLIFSFHPVIAVYSAGRPDLTEAFGTPS